METPEINPANVPAAQQTRRRRIPMSVPTRKLEVPALPGFYLYWFRESNVPRAQDAGYEFVTRDEISLNQHGVGSDRGLSGNTDMGSNVSIVAGVAEGGGVERAVLMKLKQEWHKEDQDAIDDMNAKIMQAMFGDEKIIGPGGKINELGEMEYVKTALLNRPVRKVKKVR